MPLFHSECFLLDSRMRGLLCLSSPSPDLSLFSLSMSFYDYDHFGFECLEFVFIVFGWLVRFLFLRQGHPV